MKKGILVGGIAAAALCAVVLPKILIKKPFADPVAEPIVEVTSVQYGDIILTAGLVGSVEPEDVVYVYPKASGDVMEVSIKAGQTVEEGQLLCVIDTRQIEGAKSSLNAVELALKQAKEELSRQSVLYAGGGISEQAYRQYQDGVTSAQISYDNAKVNYDNQVSYSRITAPITGTVEACNVETFDSVAQNNLLCVISGKGAKIVSFSVTERIRRNLKEGDRIQAEKDGEVYAGTVYEVSSMADSSSGLYQVKARLEDQEGKTEVSTGSKVKLYVVSESARDVMMIPVDAVYYDGGFSYVYTYDTESRSLHKVQVETGLYDAENMEIKGGLSGAEAILTTWSTELYEGTRVRLKEGSDGNN